MACVPKSRSDVETRGKNESSLKLTKSNFSRDKNGFKIPKKCSSGSSSKTSFEPMKKTNSLIKPVGAKMHQHVASETKLATTGMVKKNKLLCKENHVNRRPQCHQQMDNIEMADETGSNNSNFFQQLLDREDIGQGIKKMGIFQIRDNDVKYTQPREYDTSDDSGLIIPKNPNKHVFNDQDGGRKKKNRKISRFDLISGGQELLESCKRDLFGARNCLKEDDIKQ